MRPRLFLLVFVLLMASCFNEADYDFQQVTLSPTMAIPIASGNMGLVDLMLDDDTAYVKSYPDGLLYLYYSKVLPSTSIRDMFGFPDNTTVVSFNLPAGLMPASAVNTTFGIINRQIDLALSPELLTEALITSGTLERSLGLSKVTSPPNLPLETTITFPSVTHKTTGQPLVVTVGNGAHAGSLADYVIEMSDNRFDVSVSLVIKPHPATFIPAATTADVTLGFKAMQFGYIKGFFGDQTCQLPSQTIDISVFNSTLKDATVSFLEPHITFEATNEYGVPVELAFSVLRAKKGVSTLPIQLSPHSPITLEFPALLGNSVTTGMTITNQQAIMNFAPEQLEYAASARINKGLVSGNNFMADTSKLRIALTTEIPLYGRVTGVTVADTLEIDLSDIDAANVADASLKITAQNEIPLDADVQIYFLSDTYEVKDSLFSSNQTYIVKSSTVDGAGDLEHPGITSLDLGLNPDRLTKLFTSKYLLIRATMSTARDNNDVFLNVKFRSHYRLNLNIGMLAKINIQLK